MAVRRWPVVAAMIMGLATAASTNAQPQQPLYKDARQPVDRRVEDLLSRMTLDEKVAQLLTIWEQKAKVQTADGQFDRGQGGRVFPERNRRLRPAIRLSRGGAVERRRGRRRRDRQS